MTAIEFHFNLVNLQGSLMKFAYSLTSDKDDAKDLVQETSLKALTYRDRFSMDSNFKAWTYTIMKNTFINNYRRSLRKTNYVDNTKESFAMNQTLASASDNPESVYTAKEIEKIIDSLDDNLKLPFKMQHEGFKYNEISENLDLNIGTVKSRIFIARKKLMSQLAN